MKNEIHINDLADPHYSELQTMALDYGKTLTVDLSRESIMAEAEQKTGLNDWGEQDFISRLELLCNEWSNDNGLTGIGKLSLRNKLLQHASSRLLIQQQLAQHPEILDIEIQKPIIIIGLPRSGTTHLLNLIASDSRFQSLPLWESYEPVPMPGEGLLEDGTDPRYQRCADSWAMMQKMTPHLAAMHPMNPDHIHEELELMGPNFASYNYEWLSHSPRWRDSYYHEDQTPHYQYMKNVLKLLAWQRQGNSTAKPWILKCPQHLEQIPVLLKTFPDATFAVTHRDPVSVIQSTVTMLAYGQRMNRKKVMTTELLDYWTDRIEHLLRACTRDRHLLTASQSIDVPFEVMRADDVGMVEKIYNKAGMEMTGEAYQQLKNFADKHQHDYGRVIYDLEGQFGVKPEALAERFEFYYQAFEVPRAFRKAPQA